MDTRMKYLQFVNMYTRKTMLLIFCLDFVHHLIFYEAQRFGSRFFYHLRWLVTE